MSEATKNIQTLLRQIRTVMEESTNKYRDCSNLTRERVVFLLQKIQSLQQYSNSTLAKIINNTFLSTQLRHVFYLRLKNTLGDQKLCQKYQTEAAKPKETYFFMQTKHSTLIKEIIQNIKAIETEMTILRQNLETVCQQSSANQDTTASCHFDVGILLRMVMETSELQLQKPFDQMLFRLFILEESISLILHKTEHVLNHLSGKLTTFQVSSGKSQHSSNTKRSALSESLLIFKMNKHKEDPLEQLEQRGHYQHNRIRTDYMMQCRPEKKIDKAEKRMNCCFGF